MILCKKNETYLRFYPNGICVTTTLSMSMTMTMSKKAPRLSYHMTANQIPIIVGKDSYSNDYLTFILSEPDDYWFHVCDFPGAHVVLQNLSNVTQDDIETAAQLAVKHSKVCHGKKNYKVHYGHVRYVSKPKHAPAGLVEIIEPNYLHVRAR